MNFPPLTRAVLSLLLAQPHLRQGLLVVAGVCLTLIQGRAALQAAELPQVLTGVNARFVGAQLPVVNGNSMVINQFADKATLNWQSFNISADGSVEFKQPTSSSVALNRIFDLNPSQINGKLTANGWCRLKFKKIKLKTNCRYWLQTARFKPHGQTSRC